MYTFVCRFTEDYISCVEPQRKCDFFLKNRDIMIYLHVKLYLIYVLEVDNLKRLHDVVRVSSILSQVSGCIK